jgi:Protein of unknown function (DUF2971)
MPAHKEYREHWVNAGYERAMGSAWVRLPPLPDRITVYHLTSAEHAISNIALARIKVARFSEANDPFELLALHFLRGSHLRQATVDFKKLHDSQAGMLCFSQNWINPVLWSHYADNHKGICLGFDLLRTHAQEIRYERDRLLKELEQADDDPNKLSSTSQKLLVCTKSEHWSYEKEIRVPLKLADTMQEGSLYFYPFGDVLQLSEVILGERCSYSLDAVRKLVDAHHSNVVTIKARLASGHFSIVPKESTIP